MFIEPTAPADGNIETDRAAVGRGFAVVAAKTRNQLLYGRGPFVRTAK